MGIVSIPRCLVVAAVIGLTGGIAHAGNSPGPDVIVSIISTGNDYTYYGSSGGIHAYAFATTSCNIGTQVLNWFDAGPNNDLHPVIAQNMFRLKNNRLEQVGVSWLKHGFCAVNEFSCGSCQTTDCDTLGLDCADTYGSSLNGSATWRGARSEVNPTTGAFPYPPILVSTGPSAIRGRLQVADADINPAQNAGARYFIEVIYNAKDDLAAGNGKNSVSWREITVTDVDNIGFAGATQQMDAAINVWPDNDPAVKVSTGEATNDGMFYLAYKFQSLGGGMWRYEYSVYNYNSEQSAGGLTIPAGPGVTISNIGFHDVDSHSGEPWSNTDWAISTPGCGVKWQTEDFGTNPNANAIRWGTMYNFWFDADAGPAVVSAQLDLFKPGVDSSLSFGVYGPGGSCTMGDSDCDGDGDLVDFSRIQGCMAVGAFAPGDACRIFDDNCDSVIDAVDYAAFEATIGGP